MPPRRSARLLELANPHFQLPFPPNVVALLFSLLPLDTRLRAREVCRGWRFFLEDASFWTHVDLSEGCVVDTRFPSFPCAPCLSTLASDSRVAPALLRAACVRAKGNLQSVDLSALNYAGAELFVRQWLDSASAADKASLRVLVTPFTGLDVEQVTALCRALPLCRVRSCVMCDAVEALPLLRREPPYELLTIDRLVFVHRNATEQAVLDLAAALMVHDGLVWLHFGFVPLTTRAVVDALLDATISAGIKYASFHHCGLSQIALPALGRLLQSPGFEGLIINSNDGVALFEGPLLPAFCEALHNSTSLKVTVLESVNLWADVAAATELIAALERHPALHGLWLSNNPTDATPATQQAAGECLARLIARSTSLHVLNLPGSALGDAGRAPIFQALRNNSSLTTLGFRTLAGQGEERISTPFLRDVVLPAVRANTRLRKLEGLHSVDEEEGNPVLREVEDILEARRQADKNTV